MSMINHVVHKLLLACGTRVTLSYNPDSQKIMTKYTSKGTRRMIIRVETLHTQMATPAFLKLYWFRLAGRYVIREWSEETIEQGAAC